MSYIKLKYALITILIAAFCITVFSVIVVDYATKYVLAYSAISPRRADITKYSEMNPGKLGYRYKSISVRVENSIILKGWFVYSKKKHSRGTVFLLHGITDTKFSIPGLMNQLCDRGFNCVLFDHRAHGESGGKYCSFGYFEKYDYSKILDYITDHFPDSAPYGIMGHSLGAAISVQTMAIDKRFRCGVIQSCFANYRQVVHDYFKKITKLPVEFIADISLDESEKRVHYHVDEISPERSAALITAPVMFIHGLKDDRISAEYGKRVYNNIRSDVKIWYPILQADHDNVSQIGGKAYYKKITDFFKTYLHS